MYDVSVQMSEQVPVTVGVLTFGLVTQKIEQELVRIPASTTEVSLEITGRYDSSQYTCAADDGNETCYAAVPLRDLNWLTGDGGSRAELIVSVQAERKGTILLERTQAFPMPATSWVFCRSQCAEAVSCPGSPPGREARSGPQPGPGFVALGGRQDFFGHFTR